MPIDPIGLTAAVSHLRNAAFSRTRCFVSTPNLNFVIAARSDPEFRGSLLRSDLCLADGAPLVWVARALGLPVVARVAGADVFEALRAHRGPPLRIFFFGGPPGAAEAACRNLNANPGGLRCVGFDPAGFGSLDEMSTPARIAAINESGADFVAVALGAKRGQAWIERNADALEAPLLCHLGAVVNFAAASVSRAPTWVRRVGGEWLWRIKEEPALWRRYAGDGARFVGLALTRVLPLALSRSAADSRVGSALERCGAAEGELGVVLEGRWCRDDLGPLRAWLAESLARSARVVIGVRGVTNVDSAFVGLLLLAVGSFGSGRMKIVDASPRLRRRFRRHGAEFLLEPSRERR